jgi:hypothetical protein
MECFDLVQNINKDIGKCWNKVWNIGEMMGGHLKKSTLMVT